MKLNTFQEMVRTRLREATPNFSLLARFLKADPSTIQKRLKTGGSALCLDWLDEVSGFYQMRVAEMVTEPGAALQSVSPLEASLLDRFRKMTEMQRMSLMAVLDWRGEIPGKRGRPSHSHEDAMVLALYRAVAPDVQAAVLGLMREHPSAKQLDARRRLQKL
jgi:hypothetical protein